MFRLKIETGNAAFGDSISESLEEIARLLQVAAERVRAGADEGNLIDYNGNTVGSFALKGRRQR